MSDLARQLAWVAGDLDRRGYPAAGVVRRAARALVRERAPGGPAKGSAQQREPLARRRTPPGDGVPTCAECGDSFEPNTRGRPRKYCRTCSPPKKTEKGTV